MRTPETRTPRPAPTAFTATASDTTIRATRPLCAPRAMSVPNSRLRSTIIMTKINVIIARPTPHTSATSTVTVREVASSERAMPLTIVVEVVTFTPGTFARMSAATASTSRPGATLTMTEEMMWPVSRVVYLLRPLSREESMRMRAVSKLAYTALSSVDPVVSNWATTRSLLPNSEKFSGSATPTFAPTMTSMSPRSKSPTVSEIHGWMVKSVAGSNAMTW